MQQPESAAPACPAPALAPQSGLQAEALWGACVAACDVQRKPQYFGWMQSHLRRFLPHELAVWAVLRPGHAHWSWHVFDGVPLPAAASSALAQPSSSLMAQLTRAWLGRTPRGATIVPLLPVALAAEASDVLAPMRDAGFKSMLVHAVPGTREGHSIASLFVFASQHHHYNPTDAALVNALLPQLHLMGWRVAVHDESPATRARATASTHASDSRMLTAREREILLHVRAGQRNADIGATLGISALTVKNHVQNILRKLGASNRTQAVTEALARQLLDTPAR